MTSHRGALTMFVVAILLLASTNPACAVTAEQLCQSGRATAAAKYTSCAEKVLAKFNLGGDFTVYATAAGKCATKYAASWPKLQAKAATTGSTCDSTRFTDNGDGTVTDRLTALQWEKKTNMDSMPNFADPHDADNYYVWSGSGVAADGIAFTGPGGFLALLNKGGGCFAGSCDWRLPTRDELLTILTPAFPLCTTPPCVDPALGPTVADFHWAATTFASIPTSAWGASFLNGHVGFDDKGNTGLLRGVRSGL